VTGERPKAATPRRITGRRQPAGTESVGMQRARRLPTVPAQPVDRLDRRWNAGHPDSDHRRGERDARVKAVSARRVDRLRAEHLCAPLERRHERRMRRRAWEPLEFR